MALHFYFYIFLNIKAVMMMVMAFRDMITGVIMVVIAKIEEIKDDEPIMHSITGMIKPKLANLALIIGVMELQVLSTYPSQS